jgi:hypothetical protein
MIVTGARIGITGTLTPERFNNNNGIFLGTNSGALHHGGHEGHRVRMKPLIDAK